MYVRKEFVYAHECIRVLTGETVFFSLSLSLSRYVCVCVPACVRGRRDRVKAKSGSRRAWMRALVLVFVAGLALTMVYRAGHVTMSAVLSGGGRGGGGGGGAAGGFPAPTTRAVSQGNGGNGGGTGVAKTTMPTGSATAAVSADMTNSKKSPIDLGEQTQQRKEDTPDRSTSNTEPLMSSLAKEKKETSSSSPSIIETTDKLKDLHEQIESKRRDREASMRKEADAEEERRAQSERDMKKAGEENLRKYKEQQQQQQQQQQSGNDGILSTVEGEDTSTTKTEDSSSNNSGADGDSVYGDQKASEEETTTPEDTVSESGTNPLALAATAVVPSVDSESFTGLSTFEVKVGTGRSVHFGDTIELKFQGRVRGETKIYDTSLFSGTPTLKMPVGVRAGIEGFDEGILGTEMPKRTSATKFDTMRVGGKRVLFIPATLSWGPSGPSNPNIPSGTDLIVEVEVVSVTKSTYPDDTEVLNQKAAAKAVDLTSHGSTEDVDSGGEVDGVACVVCPDDSRLSNKAVYVDLTAPGAKPAVRVDEKLTKLVVEDVVVGKGRVVFTGDRIRTQYVGKLADGSVFEKSPQFDTLIGTGDLIQGWEQGVLGSTGRSGNGVPPMRVGGVRRLYIPYKLGYGEKGSPGVIPPNADLTMEVTLVEVLESKYSDTHFEETQQQEDEYNKQMAARRDAIDKATADEAQDEAADEAQDEVADEAQDEVAEEAVTTPVLAPDVAGSSSSNAGETTAVGDATEISSTMTTSSPSSTSSLTSLTIPVDTVSESGTNPLALAATAVVPSVDSESFTGLSTFEVKVGTGRSVHFGDTIELKFQGRVRGETKIYDTSLFSGTPTLKMPVGVRAGIEGFDEGILGTEMPKRTSATKFDTMRVGGKRVLFIPATLSWGPSGPSNPNIPSGTDLIVEVEVVSVTKSTYPDDTEVLNQKAAAKAVDLTSHGSTEDVDSGGEVDGVACVVCPDDSRLSNKAVYVDLTAPGAKPAVRVDEKLTKLVVEDVVVGKGRVVFTGDRIRTQYVGKLADGSVFEKSPQFDTLIGTGDLIQGWEQGVLGSTGRSGNGVPPMRVGGVRRLYIPYKLGYGEKGSPGVIPPNADLTMEVTLVEVLESKYSDTHFEETQQQEDEYNKQMAARRDAIDKATADEAQDEAADEAQDEVADEADKADEVGEKGKTDDDVSSSSSDDAESNGRRTSRRNRALEVMHPEYGRSNDRLAPDMRVSPATSPSPSSSVLIIKKEKTESSSSQSSVVSRVNLNGEGDGLTVNDGDSEQRSEIEDSFATTIIREQDALKRADGSSSPLLSISDTTRSHGEEPTLINPGEVRDSILHKTKGDREKIAASSAKFDPWETFNTGSPVAAAPKTRDVTVSKKESSPPSTQTSSPGDVLGGKNVGDNEEVGVLVTQPEMETCERNFSDSDPGTGRRQWYGSVGRASKLYDPFRYDVHATGSYGSVQDVMPSCQPVFASRAHMADGGTGGTGAVRVDHSVSRPLHYIAAPSGPFPVNCKGREDLCNVLREVAINREVMVAVANSHAPGIDEFLNRVVSLGVKNFVVVALDDALARRLKARGIAFYRYESDARGNHGVSAMKFPILREFLSVGCSVLLTDTDVVYLQNPMDMLYRDTDVEGMSDGWDLESLHGYADAVNDPLGGRLKENHALRIGCLNSGLWYVAATKASLRLMRIMEYRLSTENLWDQTGYNLELTLPSRDDHVVAGATMRVLSPWCFMNSKVFYRNMRQQPWFRKHTPVAVHVNYHTDKMQKMAEIIKFYDEDRESGPLPPCNGDGCLDGTPSVTELEKASINTINDSIISGRQHLLGNRFAVGEACRVQKPWQGKIDDISHELNRLPLRDRNSLPDACKTLGTLCSKALQSARQGELAVAIARDGDKERLKQFLKAAHAVGVYNLLVVATSDSEDRLCSAVASENLCVRLDAERANKFRILHALVASGLSVLFTDLDVVFVQDPFAFLYRDSDVELMSNGYDDTSAYGYDHVADDPVMKWSRYLHGSRMISRSSTFMYLVGTVDSERLLRRMLLPTVSEANLGNVRASERCNEVFTVKADPNDEAAENLRWNLELFLPSVDAYATSGVSVRVMNYLCFMNSKVLVDSQEKYLGMGEAFKPVVVNINHREGVGDADDRRLAEAIITYYNGERALELGTKNVLKSELLLNAFKHTRHPHCLSHSALLSTPEAHQAGERLATALVGSRWTWGGVQHVTFEQTSSGSRIFKTPWGEGVWGIGGADPSEPAALFLYMDFINIKHVVINVADIEEQGVFVAYRCTGDGERIIGRIIREPVSSDTPTTVSGKTSK